jgi:hypothetical protein
MKPMKLAEVRKHTGRELTVEEAAQYVSPGQSETVTLKLPRFRGVLASLVDYASVDWTSIACS